MAGLQTVWNSGLNEFTTVQPQLRFSTKALSFCFVWLFQIKRLCGNSSLLWSPFPLKCRLDFICNEFAAGTFSVIAHSSHKQIIEPVAVADTKYVCPFERFLRLFYCLQWPKENGRWQCCSTETRTNPPWNRQKASKMSTSRGICRFGTTDLILKQRTRVFNWCI